MSSIGYSFLIDKLGLTAVPPARPALLKPVTRIEHEDGHIAVPRHAAPEDHPLSHLLFALKHEGTDLQILAQAMPKIDPAALLGELRGTPGGSYIRLACYLWETFTGKELVDVPAISGATAEVFDPERYVTGPARRSARWRVAFNGLGSTKYCATVERTPALEAAMQSNLLGRTKEFVETLGKGVMDRALAWAYLHETEDSYAIEREAPSEDRARAFVALLHQAHDGRKLDEDYLVELQNAVLTDARLREFEFRGRQNWLRGPARGAAGVTYVPPPPGLVPELMSELMEFGNAGPLAIDPIVAASIVSSGFVFIHPFMDGNGRLSRFLFHQALCTSKQLERGLLLPVSVAMKRNEADYLEALQSFSRPARERWSVRWIDEGEYELTFNSDSSLYRYWNATPFVEFGYRMAEQALEVDLKSETEFLQAYDALHRAANERFDVQGNDLASLVRMCLGNEGKVSNNRRKQFALRVPEKLFDFLEENAAALKHRPSIGGENEPKPAPPARRRRP